MEKIKKLSQKLSDGTFSSPLPLGADAQNIDMLSGNDLEEEFHLGGNCITSFVTSTDGSITITEECKSSESQTNNFYKMITTFSAENDQTVIKQQLYYIDKQGKSSLKKTKTVNFENVNNNLKIKEVLT